MCKLYDGISCEKLKYLVYYYKGDREGANRFKHSITPKSLYRYEKITDRRLETLRNNQIYLSDVTNFNDPYDCMGVFWDINEIKEFLDNDIIYYELNKLSIEDLNNTIIGLLKYANTPIRLTCFSEFHDSLPMWGNYADSGKGFCVEYDFTHLDYDNDISKMLMPISYEENKISITKGFISSCKASVGRMAYNPDMFILFFKNLVKHRSWSYEQEWRIIDTEGTNILNLPMKPTAIYSGINCTPENKNTLKLIADDLGCKYFQMNIAYGSGKMFDFVSD